MRTTIELDDVLRVRVALTNVGGRRYSLDALTVTTPARRAGRRAADVRGRWAREFHPVRRSGRTARSSSRTGGAGRPTRTRPCCSPASAASTSGAARCGAHTSRGAATTRRSPSGSRRSAVRPVRRAAAPRRGRARTRRVVHDARRARRLFGDGLTAATWGFHRSVRARPPDRAPTGAPQHVGGGLLRPRLRTLRALADAAADLGIERFVLDDGWFGSRRDDTRGLGDWWVSDNVYPDGLEPLIGHVTGLGMEFGIWVEPEMVNPDSDVFRAHPDWALTTDGYEPMLGRQQLVLDLANPDAYAFIFEHLDALLRDHDISYVKWDMNRDHIQGRTRRERPERTARRSRCTACSTSCAPPIRRRVRVVRQRGRPDRPRDPPARRRVWTSDCNDALERQTIQRGASMLIPPEVMGAHIGPRRRTPPGGRRRCRSARRPRSSGISASSGTSPGSATRTGWRCAPRSPCTKSTGRSSTAATPCASTPTRRTRPRRVRGRPDRGHRVVRPTRVVAEPDAATAALARSRPRPSVPRRTPRRSRTRRGARGGPSPDGSPTASSSPAASSPLTACNRRHSTPSPPFSSA